MTRALGAVGWAFGALLFATGCGAPDPDQQPGFTGLAGAAGAAGTTTGGSGGASGGSGGAASAGGGTGSAGVAGSGGSGGDATKWPIPDWPAGAPEAHGFDAAGLQAAGQLAETLDSFCLLVIKDGVLVSEQYMNGADAAMAPPSWSIAKSYSSTLVGIALQRGDFSSLDQKVSDFVPEWKADARAQITLRHLVSMTSGLSWSAWSDYVSMATFAPDHTAFATGLEAKAEPGSEWTYHNGGVQMLEPVFRAATGMTIEEYAEAHLWSRLGMSATWGKDKAGNPTPYANVLATCRDHARLGYLYLHGGQWGAEQVVPAAWVLAATTPSQFDNRAYGYLWWLNAETPAMDAMMSPWPGRMSPSAPSDLFAARGFGNQFIDVIPSKKLVVVRFGKDPAGTLDLGAIAKDQRFEKHDQILNAVLSAMK